METTRSQVGPQRIITWSSTATLVHRERQTETLAITAPSQDDSISGSQIEHWNNYVGVSGTVVELDAAGAIDGLYQDIATASGQSYTLSYDVFKSPGIAASSCAFEVYWRGTLVDSYSPTAEGWVTRTIQVIGSGGNDRLEFREAASGNDNSGALIDNVALRIADNDLLIGGLGAGHNLWWSRQRFLYGDTTNSSNLLTNGSFESLSGASLPSAGSFVAITANQLTGWTITGSQGVDIQDKNFVYSSNNNAATGNTDGQYYLDLGETSANGSISQTVTGVVSGEALRLSFDIKMPTTGSNELLNVYWGGALVGTITSSSSNWQTYSYNLAAGSGNGNNTLTFEEVGNLNNAGTLLDNVRLERAGGNDQLTGGASSDLPLQTVANENFNSGATGWSSNTVNSSLAATLSSSDCKADLLELNRLQRLIHSLPAPTSRSSILISTVSIHGTMKPSVSTSMTLLSLRQAFINQVLQLARQSVELPAIRIGMQLLSIPQPIEEEEAVTPIRCGTSRWLRLRLEHIEIGIRINTGSSSTDESYGIDNVVIKAGLRPNGMDVIDGGGGIDTAYYSGAFSGYAIKNNNNGTIDVLDLTLNRDGYDRTSNVEYLRFSNGTYVTALNSFNYAITNTSLSASTVAENAANGTTIGTITRTDLDASDTVTYSLLDSANSRFAIHATTGVITVANGAQIDYESATSHTITVRATDSVGQSHDKVFTIGITAVNEVPTFQIR